MADIKQLKIELHKCLEELYSLTEQNKYEI